MLLVSQAVFQTASINFSQTDNDTNQGCLQDCPADCQCRKLSDGKIVVSSRSISAVPLRFPRETTVM
ncbi:hypothetical protein AC249_AIPGENE611 [Exaiptasia diaphana]|nr:hypothetical protein AC249_AIPGENE611 [Exaiptasia diaphana]